MTEFVVVGLLYAFGSSLHKELDNELKNSMEAIRAKDVNAPLYWPMIHFQRSFECCGASEPGDYLLNGTSALPDSCCGKDGEGFTCEKENAYKRGCIQAFNDDVIPHLKTTAGLVLALGLFQLVGVFFSCCLGYTIRQNYESV